MQNQFQTEETPAPRAVMSLVPETEATGEVLEEMPTRHTTAERLAAFQKKRKRHKARLLKYLFGIAAMIFIPVGLVPILLGLFEPALHLLPFALFASFLIPLLTYLFFWMLRKPVSDADELVRLGGVNAIGDLLIMVSESVSHRDTRALLDALTRLLPQLKTSDSNLLNRMHRTLLDRHLHTLSLPVQFVPRRFDFGIAILQALEQVGDKTSLATVRRLANMKAYTPQHQRLKDAAIQCLPALEANLGQVDATQTLLRASMPEAAPPDTLLRPASFTPAADTKHLLRAASSEEPSSP